VPLVTLEDPRRPWEMVGSGGVFCLRRERRGNSSEWQYFTGAATRVVEFGEDDAAAMLERLRDESRHRHSP
jgi:hypothetical protein